MNAEKQTHFTRKALILFDSIHLVVFRREELKSSYARGVFIQLPIARTNKLPISRTNKEPNYLPASPAFPLHTPQ